MRSKKIHCVRIVETLPLRGSRAWDQVCSSASPRAIVWRCSFPVNSLTSHTIEPLTPDRAGATVVEVLDHLYSTVSSLTISPTRAWNTGKSLPIATLYQYLGAVKLTGAVKLRILTWARDILASMP